MDRYFLSEHRDAGIYSHLDPQSLPAVRALPAPARATLPILVLQMLGLWAAAWAALASASSWLR
jgi:hypothetical protein